MIPVPDGMRRNCALAIGRARRLPEGERARFEQAWRFAQRACPPDGSAALVDVVDAVSCEQAHVDLAFRLAEFPVGREPDDLKLQRMLWGGDAAVEWAQDVIAHSAPKPEPESARPQVIRIPEDLTSIDLKAAGIVPGPPMPIAAEAGPRAVLADLGDRLFTIDETIIGRLESAFWMAYRTAVARAGSSVQAGVCRGKWPLTMQAEAGLQGDNLNQLREAVKAAGRFDKWSTVPDRVHAVLSIELDRAIEDTLADFEETAFAILAQGVDRAVGAVASATEVDRAEVAGRGPAEGRLRDAAGYVAAGLLAWVRARLAGPRLPEDLGEVVVPEGLLRNTVAVAGGATPSGDFELVRDGSGVAVGLDGRGVPESIGVGLADRVVDDIADGALVGLLLAARPTRTLEWVYGDASERETPFEPHRRLGGTSWDEGAAGPGWYPGDHVGCRCRLRRGWRF